VGPGSGPEPRPRPGAVRCAEARSGVTGPAGATGGVVQSGGERGGQRSRWRRPGGRWAPAARTRFRASASPGTRISPATRITPATGISPGTGIGNRVAAHTSAQGALEALPIVARVRRLPTAWDGPTGHPQIQMRLVAGIAALTRPRVQAGIPAWAAATCQRRVQPGIPA
jgi:hypothetical protein